jgi:hypothetical protein
VTDVFIPGEILKQALTNQSIALKDGIYIIFYEGRICQKLALPVKRNPASAKQKCSVQLDIHGLQKEHFDEPLCIPQTFSPTPALLVYSVEYNVPSRSLLGYVTSV